MIRIWFISPDTAIGQRQTAGSATAKGGRHCCQPPCRRTSIAFRCPKACDTPPRFGGIVARRAGKGMRRVTIGHRAGLRCVPEGTASPHRPRRPARPGQAGLRVRSRSVPVATIPKEHRCRSPGRSRFDPGRSLHRRVDLRFVDHPARFGLSRSVRLRSRRHPIFRLPEPRFPEGTCARSGGYPTDFAPVSLGFRLSATGRCCHDP